MMGNPFQCEPRKALFYKAHRSQHQNKKHERAMGKEQEFKIPSWMIADDCTK